MKKNEIHIYTDGSCIGNPGPGGWGVIVLFGDDKIELKGGAKDSTNNRMEMTAVIKALEWLHKKSKFTEKQLNKTEITIHSDSNLIVQTMNQGWKRKANTDLWAKIDKSRSWLNITWKWVKAHHNNKYNNEADKLALSEAVKQKKK